jgi:NAD(P)-dependent dehydrogenase (short-subunit alcohol dehydrogenase family)
MTWTTSNIPSQHGRTAVITGTGGLGLEDALALARAGADVIIAGRNAQKGAEAVERVTADVPNAKVRFEQVDLASLASVETFGKRLSGQLGRLDLLINNAAVMTPPKREQTSDGFELQLGTNYLGHVALTAHLMPLLKNGKDARVVTLSSVAAREGKLDFDDLQSERSYASMKAYGQSKLACLMFGRELHRQSVANGWGVTSLVAHPGISRTDLLHNAPGKWSAAGMARTFLWFLFQPPAQGALPTLYAATSPDAQGGGYYGPHALSETRGYPTAAKVPPQAEDRAAAERLWRTSLELTRVSF